MRAFASDIDRVRVQSEDEQRQWPGFSRFDLGMMISLILSLSPVRSLWNLLNYPRMSFFVSYKHDDMYISICGCKNRSVKRYLDFEEKKKNLYVYYLQERRIIRIRLRTLRNSFYALYICIFSTVI